MKKSKVMTEIENLWDNNDAEQVVGMIDFMKMQHSCTLDLAKLDYR